MTYNVNSVEALGILQDQLTHSLDCLSKTIPQQDGLLIEGSKTDKRCATEQPPEYGSIPLPKKRKIPTTSRVGRGNENKKEASSIKVPSINISVTKKIKVIEEPVPVEDNCLYDFPIEIPIQCNSPKCW